MTTTVVANANANPLGRFSQFPRASLCHAPTPLEAMPNLSAIVAGAQLFIKRDDCTGLAMGGNKVRKLEYYMGEAVAQSADTVLITGAVQSNFVRMAAAAARKLNMDVHIQLEERVALDDPAYRDSGNVLLDRLLGATIHSYPTGEDESGADANLEAIADRLRQDGRKPYVIHLGLGHVPLGALGYIRGAAELLEQMRDRGLTFDEIVVASGSGSTHAGLLFGLRALSCNIPVTGVCVRRPREPQTERIKAHCKRIAATLDIPNPVPDADVVIIDDFLAPGYGQLNTPTIEALKLVARSEAILLDPVYTAKVMAGAIHRARGRTPQERLLFVHTGGSPALFGYEPLLTSIL